jgi:hypothetical protein
MLLPLFFFICFFLVLDLGPDLMIKAYMKYQSYRNLKNAKDIIVDPELLEQLFKDD